MRYRERGVGNMAFIIVLVLLLIAAAMAFMKSDEVSENLKLAQKATKSAMRPSCARRIGRS